MRSYRSATAPGLGMPFIERQQGIPIDPPDSPRSHGGQVKGRSWGLNRLYFKAVLPSPGPVFGFCSPWAETPTGKLLRTFRKSYKQRPYYHRLEDVFQLFCSCMPQDPSVRLRSASGSAWPVLACNHLLIKGILYSCMNWDRGDLQVSCISINRNGGWTS